MEEWFVHTTEFVVLAIEAIALIVIAYGVLEAVVGTLRTIAHRADRREVWVHFARWLVAGLTFQLAADILETSIQQSWFHIGQLAAIAVIRTFLSYFLERDMEEVRELEQEKKKQASS